MKTSYVAIIFATIFFILIAGCVSSPPPPEPKDKVDSNSTIKLLNNKIPELKKQFDEISKEIQKAESEKINVTDVRLLIQGNEQKIIDIGLTRLPSSDVIQHNFNTRSALICFKTMKLCKNKNVP